MVSKEMIKKEIDNIPEELLGELHQIIKEFVKSKNARNKGNLMAKLRQIKIQGPKDFSKNIDVYLSREKIGE
ncbi:MAG: hypothetical protein D6813_14960 [Calditrichaeota bacterium]|nr:MAG: hypothetical protein D6813_14960 [Calditrichota bacterium]